MRYKPIKDGKELSILQCVHFTTLHIRMLFYGRVNDPTWSDETIIISVDVTSILRLAYNF